MKKLILFLPLLISVLFVDAQFGPENNISKATTSPLKVIAFDLDGDSDLDVITGSNRGAELTWNENLGSGNFSVQKVIADRIDVLSIYAADLDGDNDIDIIAGLDQGEIVWFENAGNGIFSSEQSIANSFFVSMSVHANDIDGDGDMDVIGSAYNMGEVAWFENLGNGSFGSKQVITTLASQARCVHSADLDNDGDIDVLSASQADDKIAWYENLGGGTFGPQRVISTNADYAQSVYTADINSDGKLDVLSASLLDNKVAWYINLGNGIFSGEAIISTSCTNASSVFSADMDGDGDDDVLATAQGSDQVYWYKNLGGGFSGVYSILNGADFASSVFAADMDGDGDNDVLSVATADNEIALNLNQGAGIFSPPIFLTSHVVNMKQHIAVDIDGDGSMDVVGIYGWSGELGQLVWYKNLGNGEFGAQQVIFESWNGLTSVHANDLDGDGDVDVICSTNLDDKVSWFENLGGGVFGSQQVITTDGDLPNSVFSADMDGDGDIDIVSGSYLDDKVGWCENLGAGVFGPLQTITTLADGVIQIYVEDIDGDSDMDVFSVSELDKEVAWYKNIGGGMFAPQQIIVTATNSVYSIHIADLDGDGDMDVIPGLGALVWYKNLNGAFTTVQYINISNSYFAATVHASDMDGDGDNDILYSSAESMNPDDIAWVENLGGGTFGLEQVISSKFSSVKCLSTFDMDNDGTQDLLISSYYDITGFENFFNSPYKLSGNVFYDSNQNSMQDVGELGLNFIPVSLSLSNAFFFSLGGSYSFYTNIGVYSVGYSPNPVWDLTTDSSSYTKTLTGTNPIADSLDFGFYPNTITTIIEPELTGGFPRCNTIINYWVNIRNEGTTLPDGIVHLQLDDSISYISSAITPDSIVGQNIYWHFDSLFFFAEENFNIQVQLPPFTSVGDTLTSFLTVNELDGSGNIVYTNSDTLDQILVCAYDPNDKTVLPKGIGSQGFIANNQPLEYLIRFQNTGNDTAIAVMVRDQLDDNLDWSSLQPIASSHPMQVSIEQDGEAVFKFTNIMLPDSNVDFLGSQGFVKFSINQKPSLAPGIPIFNTGHIYFDFNPAVITNTVLNTIEDTTGLPVSVQEFTFTETNEIIVFPNPFTEHITVYYKAKINTAYHVSLFDMAGKEMLKRENITSNKTEFDVSQLKNGVYIIVGTDTNGKKLFSERIIAQ